jgi:hypothetical protein
VNFGDFTKHIIVKISEKSGVIIRFLVLATEMNNGVDY